MKQRLNLSLIDRYEPRIFLSVFGETHLAGHYFWRFVDERHPEYENHQDASDALLCVYSAIDCAVGEVFEKHSHRANCFVFSGHGMGADYNPYYVLDDLLCKMNLTVRPTDPGATQVKPINRMRDSLSDALPTAAKRLLNKYFLTSSLRESLMLSKVFRGILFSDSKAFALPSDLQGFIRINLKGREPAGTVAASEYDGLCDDIEQELYALKDVVTRTPVVERVFRSRRIYAGADNVDALPDLSVQWNTRSPITKVYSERHGILEGDKTMAPERSGNHRPEGFFFAVGPDIDTSVKDIRGDLLDIAPTIFSLIGKKIPGDWDGAPLKVFK